MLLNVGSGGGAPAAGATGGAAATGGEAAAEEKEEEKAEGMFWYQLELMIDILIRNREGRIRRRHGIRSIRLSVSTSITFHQHLVMNQVVLEFRIQTTSGNCFIHCDCAQIL